jgi:predicted ester cyclase
VTGEEGFDDRRGHRDPPQHADWAGIPTTGRSFSIRVAAVYEFEGDQVVCERAYTDFADWARQLGAAM